VIFPYSILLERWRVTLELVVTSMKLVTTRPATQLLTAKNSGPSNHFSDDGSVVAEPPPHAGLPHRPGPQGRLAPQDPRLRQAAAQVGTAAGNTLGLLMVLEAKEIMATSPPQELEKSHHFASLSSDYTANTYLPCLSGSDVSSSSSSLGDVVAHF
jgi:hypothetical protein